MRKLAVQSGHCVWVQGGTGGVGGFGIQICRSVGATVITTASAGNSDYVAGLGADHVIDYNSEDVGARILEITDGRGVDTVQAAVDTNSAAEPAIPCIMPTKSVRRGNRPGCACW